MREVFGIADPFDISSLRVPIASVDQVDLTSGYQGVTDLYVEATSHEFEGPAFVRAIADSDDLAFLEKRAALRDSAISKLAIVVRHCKLECVDHTFDASDPSGLDNLRETLDAVLGVRSPHTVTKRADSLLSYFRWHSKSFPNAPLSFSEEVVWGYFKSLRDSGAPPTKMSSCMSAFRFAKHILGLSGLDDTVRSRRLCGIAEISLSGKRLLRQAKVLTVEQVLKLHKLLIDSSLCVMDRVLVAYLLFALYARCRHSDLLHVEGLQFDCDETGGFAECKTSQHKTGRTAIMKSMLMPLLAPAKGVDGSVWALQVQSLFVAVGLDNPNGNPLVPAPSASGESFLRRGLKSNEVTKLLRLFLGLEVSNAQSDGEVVTSHSLKATALSWASKYGLTPESRSLLGRHATSLQGTYSLYSRDLLVAPTRDLQTVIDSIAEGRFCPDAPRSQFFPTDPPHAIRVQHATEEKEGPNADSLQDLVIEVSDSGSDSSSSSSGTEVSSEGEFTPPPVKKVKRFIPRLPASEEWLEHKKSHILHKVDDAISQWTGRRFLVCGKAVNNNYRVCSEANALNSLCKLCNRK